MKPPTAICAIDEFIGSEEQGDKLGGRSESRTEKLIERAQDETEDKGGYVEKEGAVGREEGNYLEPGPNRGAEFLRSSHSGEVGQGPDGGRKRS